ncbi:hypothetical protein CLV84_0807 [Neolewinella xylanilytica]|uniref:Uncharacterized protein n=1 Tax=Neolewinella xylanilytica TaxID=1514080 RepID=A0A2S6I8M6_9BACT|nr:hypothetical protein [Neolewinella xylanilytica]PPK87854.1 hypothetical protein CLV84_0807 [Neolewinella xylanilytica]
MYRFLLACMLLPLWSSAQFRDDFDVDSQNDYILMTGDGDPTMALTARNGHGIISIDATRDRHNVWWTILKRDVSDLLDLPKLEDPANELLVEARVKISAAPRRVNFMVVTNRTTDFHEHLREFDIADTSEWHTISFLTRDLDVRADDTLYVQFCATDFGPDTYEVQLDYFRADIVKAADASPEQGEPLMYHPEVPDLATFDRVLPVAQNAVIAPDYPEVNFSNWTAREGEADVPVLSVGRGQYALLRWELDDFRGEAADGAGILELTTQAVASGGNYREAYGDQLGEEFPKVRIIEVMGGDPDWQQDSVTYDDFLLPDGSEPLNQQMIFDVAVTAGRGSVTHVTLSRPVMQRLLDGTTTGLIIKPLGLINASFYANDGDQGPKLYFNLRQTAGR